MTADDLIAFEQEVAERYNRGEIRGPVHFSGGNEDALIDIFQGAWPIPKDAWIFSTWRSHYHALLHGVPPEKIMEQIMAGRSMNLNFPEHRFFTSAIVGGILPIAAGVAYTGADVYAFVGDMTYTTGIQRETINFCAGSSINLVLIVEDNGMSTNAPTDKAWGTPNWKAPRVQQYKYERRFPHVGTGTFVRF